MTVMLGLILDGSILRRCNVARGHTLSNDLLLIRTRETILPLHLATMNSALVCCLFSSSNSSGEKEMWSTVKMEFTMCLRASSKTDSGTFTSLSALTKAFRWVFMQVNRLIKEIWAGVSVHCSTTLYSLTYINLASDDFSSSFLSFFSPWLNDLVYCSLPNLIINCPW